MAAIAPEELRGRILFERPGWLVLDKPAGFETIVRGGGNTRYCLTAMLRRALGNRDLAPAHRLDRDTTGCLLFGKTKAAAGALEELFRGREVKKTYLGVAFGEFSNAEGVIRRRLSKWRGGRKPVRVTKGKDGHEAETAYRVCGTGRPKELNGPVALVRFSPRTGRTHQIRVHAADLGRPLLGDDQYGARPVNRAVRELCGLARHALHAWRIALPDPESGERTSVEAPLPEDFRIAMDTLLPGVTI